MSRQRPQKKIHWKAKKPPEFDRRPFESWRDRWERLTGIRPADFLISEAIYAFKNAKTETGNARSRGREKHYRDTEVCRKKVRRRRQAQGREEA